MNELKTSLIDKHQIPKFILDKSIALKSDSQNDQIVLSELSEIIRFIMSVLDERKAFDIQCFDLSSCSNVVSDYIILSKHSSQKSIYALSKYLHLVIKKYCKITPVEDFSPESAWIAIDVGPIIIHLITETENQKYQLDALVQEIIASNTIK